MNFLTALDTEILWLIQGFAKSPPMDSIMIFFSTIGDLGAVWIIITLAMFIKPRTRKLGYSMGLAMLLCYLVGNLGIKPLTARIRPFDYDTSIVLLIPPPGDFSFPSGHTMNAFAATTALGFGNRQWGSYAMFLAVAIAFSRLYLMVHYPTDIIAGVLVGVFGGYIAHRLVDKFAPAPKHL